MSSFERVDEVMDVDQAGFGVRGRLRLAACCVLFVLAAAFLLAGCATAGAKSAEKLAITPAFGEDFLVVHEGMVDHEGDAKLVGVSVRQAVEEGSESKWAYRYVSRKQVREYNTWLKGGEFYYQTRQQGSSFLQSEMDAVPDWSEIAVDADEAYALVVKQLDDAHLVSSVNIYLRTFISVTENAGDSGVETMTWYFAFNQQGEDGEDEEHSESAGAPQFVYAVDAVTGEVSLVADGVEAAE